MFDLLDLTPVLLPLLLGILREILGLIRDRRRG